MTLYSAIWYYYNMKYTRLEAAEILNTCTKTVDDKARKLSLGTKIKNRVYFSEIEIELIRQNVKYKIPPKVLSDNGKTATIEIDGVSLLVDSEFLPEILKHAWKNNRNNYFSFDKRMGKKSIVVYLHRLITNTPKGFEVDHINHDKLDNRKCNLRICTRSENLCNKVLSDKNTSGYKGVCYSKDKKKWQAVIGKSNKSTYLGYFNTPEEAYAAYCKAAKELHGEFARFA